MRVNPIVVKGGQAIASTYSQLMQEAVQRQINPPPTPIVIPSTQPLRGREMRCDMNLVQQQERQHLESPMHRSRPSLPVPPPRLRPRRPQSGQAPPGATKPSRRVLTRSVVNSVLSPPPEDPKKPDPWTEPPVCISSDLLAALVLGAGGGDGVPDSATAPSLFERGRFYELYSARRNERLQRRREEETTLAEEPGVTVDLKNGRNPKRTERATRSVPADLSTREIKKPRHEAGVTATAECSAVVARSVRRL
ncbi:hypothetical protein GW17_00022294 [Ensete ventricosum]|nr:hypothetical protein GW17_00022294 [Ensete ventricosum]